MKPLPVTTLGFLIAHLYALCLFGGALFAEENPKAFGKPNIVFILADDLGLMDTATYGSKYYETPNIDRLAEQGMKFTRYYNCTCCSPTRAALMTGQYSPRTGVYMVGTIEQKSDWHNRLLRPVENNIRLTPDKITIAQALKNAGYTTGMFGKWHLGGGHPGERGFDEAITSQGAHFNFITQPPVEHSKDAYLADWLTDRAVDFIRHHKDGPFFLYLPHYGVHSPWQAKENWIEHFKSKPGVGGHGSPLYAAMIASVDESVGRVMALLDELKIADNTVLIFSSDNGGVGGYDREGILGATSITDNAPLRSGKCTLYEGGTRDPFIVRWPGHVPPGSMCGVPAIHVDVYPTLLELAGAPPPANHPLDGESLVPLLLDGSPGLRREAIYQHFPGYIARKETVLTTPGASIIVGDWKLIEFFEDGRLELYNLSDDIGETTNLALKMPEKAAELHAKMLAWRADIKAPMPTPNTGVTKSVGKKPGKAGKKTVKQATEE